MLQLIKHISLFTLLVPAFASFAKVPIDSVNSLQRRKYSVDESYTKAYHSLYEMLQGNQALTFKKAVFEVENAYYLQEMDFDKFDNEIQKLVSLIQLWSNTNRLIKYPFPDSVAFARNGAIFHIMTDTLFLTRNRYLHLPYTYNFDDFFGDKNWSNMFVSKLLITNKGNCHSLPYLYKLLADEINTEAYLAFAPNHIYIKHRSKRVGWYNTELTSHEFPTDAWITASGYITLPAIQNGLYMDTIGNQQCVAMCLIDLAKGYQKSTRNPDINFLMNCCNASLKYFPNNINALLLKAETIKQKFDTIKAANNYKTTEQAVNNTEGKQTYNEMEQLYAKIIDLGYREMPEQMYFDWLKSLTVEKEKYRNKKINPNFKTSSR